jgi:2-polyprenyl-3-methyl-5-hydroxy-6-metoxy-1,4-benzoquinol methylase
MSVAHNEDANRMADYYKEYITYSDFYLCERSRIVTTILYNVMKSASIDVVDIGCNAGELLSKLPASWNKVGIDLSRKALIVAHERVNAQFVLCDASRLPLLKGAFDLVICSEVLEHIANLESTMSQISHVIKKGGRLMVTVPNLVEIYGWILILSRFAFLLMTDVARIRSYIRTRTARTQGLHSCRLTSFESHVRILSPFAWRRIVTSQGEVLLTFGILLLPMKDILYRLFGARITRELLKLEDRLRVRAPFNLLSNGIGFIALRK